MFGLLFLRNKKKTHADPSILQACLLCLKRNVSQTFESSSYKNVYPNLIRGMFFIPCDNWKILFFMQIFHFLDVWCNRHVVAFFETSVLNCAFYVRYLHNNTTLALLKVQNKVVMHWFVIIAPIFNAYPGLS